MNTNQKKANLHHRHRRYTALAAAILSLTAASILLSPTAASADITSKQNAQCNPSSIQTFSSASQSLSQTHLQTFSSPAHSLAQIPLQAFSSVSQSLAQTPPETFSSAAQPHTQTPLQASSQAASHLTAGSVITIDGSEFASDSVEDTGWNYDGNSLFLDSGYSFSIKNCSCEISNSGTIVSAENLTDSCIIYNASDGLIEGGSFPGDITNNGEIRAANGVTPIFAGKVVNGSDNLSSPGTISSGIFRGFVENTAGSFIRGGSFEASLLNRGTMINASCSGNVTNSGSMNGTSCTGPVTSSGSMTAVTCTGTVTSSGAVGNGSIFRDEFISKTGAACVGATFYAHITDSESPVIEPTNRFHIRSSLTHATLSGESAGDLFAYASHDLKINLTAADGYSFPDSLSFTVNGVNLAENKFSYDAAKGEFVIPAAGIRGIIVVTGSEAAPKPSEGTDPAATPTPKPTANPTPKPTADPTPKPEPTAAPSPSPSPNPSPPPIPDPTPDPSVNPNPSPSPDPSAGPDSSSDPDPSADPDSSSDPDPSADPDSSSDPDPSADPDSSVTPDGTSPSPASEARTGGEDRYETSVKIAEKAFPEGTDEAIVVTGEKFPDALAAGPYAGALSCPILLTRLSGLSPDTKALLQKWGTVKTIHLIGGEFDSAVEKTLRNECGITVIHKIAGADRFETAEMICAEGLREGLFTAETCVLATGLVPADALSISPWSYHHLMPVLLAGPGGTLSPSTRSAVSLFKNVCLIGGESAISSETRESLAGNVLRLAGEDRYETSVRVADHFANGQMKYLNRTALASGETDHFPDALTGGPLQGKFPAPVLLVHESSGAALAFVKEHYAKAESGVSAIGILGGKESVPDNVYEEIFLAAGIGNNAHAEQ